MGRNLLGRFGRSKPDRTVLTLMDRSVCAQGKVSALVDRIGSTAQTRVHRTLLRSVGKFTFAVHHSVDPHRWIHE
jgi:hypothetical protein